MTPRQRRRAPPAEPGYQPGQLLDWRDARHWSARELPCRYCGFPTNLRDTRMKPAHKVCAEDALAMQAAEAQAAYHPRGTL
ncbi:hypothetical protein [Streptomyces sp. NBC_01171]|uniref:hypothetical protein n=1 Tax=Streptomyces sp. NBC_01171 TaxID=2903757 RepID=UPI003865AA11|nr:hypothetical protein OG448_15080 [Streptomyces sp. NBC_01171]